ncbi:MAG: cupin domain-containing protein, partial [Clostridiales bacterium]|nr:cupin domain-containing protein [Clostridiales bacterium]
MKYVTRRIHIKPEDYLGRFEEYDEKSPSYVNYYTEAVGPYQSQEISDTIYHKNDEVPYHVHNRGVELFLIDHGSAECWIDGRRVMAEKGDMILIPPYVSHGFRYLDDNRTIWRELFQEIQMNEGILQAHRLRSYYPESFKDPQFMEEVNRRTGSVWFNYKPLLIDADKKDVPYIRSHDYAINRFEIDGISFLQKVAKHETNGNIEVWQ